MEKLKLWIDDTRPAPAGWYHIKSVNEFKSIFDMLMQRLREDEIEVVSLDHDSGVYNSWGGDYINILTYLEYKAHEYPNVRIPAFEIHSFNSVGAVNMRAIIQHNNWKEIY